MGQGLGLTLLSCMSLLAPFLSRAKVASTLLTAAAQCKADFPGGSGERSASESGSSLALQGKEAGNAQNRPGGEDRTCLEHPSTVYGLRVCGGAYPVMTLSERDAERVRAHLCV